MDSKRIKNLFHNIMLKLYTKTFRPIKDPLILVDTASQHSNIEDNANIVDMVHDENDERFLESQQKEGD